jgi:hypothetical protein
MGMCVIPVKARWLIERDIDAVVQRLSWHRHHGDDIILWRTGGNMKTVKVEVCHVPARPIHAGFRGMRRHPVEIVDLNNVSGRCMNHRRNLLSAIEEGGFAGMWIVDGLQSKRGTGYGQGWECRSGREDGIRLRWHP